MRRGYRMNSALAAGPVLACLVVAALSLPTQALAQERQDPVPKLLAEDPNYPDLDVAAAAREAMSRFQLFGEQDAAFSSWRGKGTAYGKVTNEGPAGKYLTARTLLQRGTVNGTQQAYFEVVFWSGVPNSEWGRAVERVPELAGAKGGGFVSQWNGELLFPPNRNAYFGVDGALGTHHSGVISTQDGACTDHQDGFTGGISVPLMAGTDCEDTWGSASEESFDRLISRDNWVAHFDTLLDKSEFNWDFWRQPETSYTEDYIGDFQTYAVFSDWTAERLDDFGDLIPAQAGSGDPAVDGWPLGLTVKFDAYTFQLPTVVNSFYWRAVIVNESEQVYGVGLDYDSLYIGMVVEPLHGQGTAGYYRPDIGALLHTENGVHPDCNGAEILPGVSGCGTTGFNNGVYALMVLKSPIGDLRNKLFTRRSDGTQCVEGEDPWCFPAHPNAGDTITFNHGHMCGYGSCYLIHHNRSARASFGMHSSTFDNMLDGRDPLADLTDRDYWRSMRPWDWPARNGYWNRYVTPEGWSYSNRPASAGTGPDTLYLDSCLGNVPEHPEDAGCVQAWSDTMPGGINNRYMNISVMGIGPFPLAAGETTPLHLAFVGAPDSASVESFIRNTTNFYFDSYFGPKPPPNTRIVGVEADPGDRGRAGGNEVRIFFDDAAEGWVDPFLAKLATDLEGTPLAINNDWLIDSLEVRAASNIEALHIFKSCDLGDNFTASSECDRDPAVDDLGNPVALGWQAYTTFTPAADGALPNTYTDQNVTSGVEYLYTVVAETRGATYSVVETEGAAPVEIQFAPKIYNTLSISVADPHVSRIYVPARRQAGAEAAEIEYTEDDRLASSEFHPIEVLLARDLTEEADYRVRFGDRVTVKNWADTTTVLVEQIVPGLVEAATPPDSEVVAVVVGEASYMDVSEAGVSLAGGVPAISGDTVITTFDGLTVLVVDVSDGGSRPLFVSDRLDGTTTTPGEFLGRDDFTGWLLNVEDGLAGDENDDRYLDFRNTPPDTIRSVGEPSVEWRDASATDEMYGKYQIIFEDSEYGPARMFTINQRDPEATRAALDASLAARSDAGFTEVDLDPAILDQIGADPDLIRVGVPFRVVNLTNDPNTDVQLAMLRSAKEDSITLGSGFVTLRAPVDSGKWVPEEELIFIETLRSVPLKGEYNGVEYFLRDGSGSLVIGDTTVVTWTGVLLGCAAPASGCNPIGGSGNGATGHVPFRANQAQEIEFLNPFTSRTEYLLGAIPSLAGVDVSEIGTEALQEIKVVPNPYVVWSEFEQEGQPRLMFTGLPPQGTITIYTVSGQFVQRITYVPDDLLGAGDLFWNMRSREGNEIGSGLYIFVLEGEYDFQEVNGEQQAQQKIKKLGKFVVIR